MRLSTKKVTTTPLGMSGALAAKTGSIAPDTTTRATKATNHRTTGRAPTNHSAQTANGKEHSHDGAAVRHPPSHHCQTKGSIRLIHSWLLRNSRSRRDRAN